ncbi:MAG: phosphoglucosamine mutase [Saprospiraceae bacterium]|nr:phosphoglucosamine mutase [Saprospiraceae bacterium]
MALLITVSGARGTIGGTPGDNLTPMDVVACAAGFAELLNRRQSIRKIVVGRDGRISGDMVSNLGIQTLIAMGYEVVDLGYSTTPTVEVMVPYLGAGGGIIFTASHNPVEWNALKFLNEKGEFISPEDGQLLKDIILHRAFTFSGVHDLGNKSTIEGQFEYHIRKILEYRHVKPDLIRQSGFRVVVDCINSTGALAIPVLLDALGVEYILINEGNFGHFAHNPEPLPQHLEELSRRVVTEKAHLGISVDPDVDRLALVCEDGSMFGEEYTLVAVADYILSKEKGNTVSNLSSSRALADVTHAHGGQYFAAAVGEVNVVQKMKECQAVIGGEGNGGVIVPDIHYGRDALAGIALFLSLLAERKLSMTELRKSYPQYTIIKDKIEVEDKVLLKPVFEKLEYAFSGEKLNKEDGLKIDFPEGWVHVRASNTEPIARIYAEASEQKSAEELIQKVKSHL